MITDSYDTSEPIISVDSFTPKHEKTSDVCLVTFSDKIVRAVESTFKCKKIGYSSPISHNSSILSFEYEGVPVSIYRSSIGAPSAAIDMITAAQYTGATKFILFGSAGSLNQAETENKYVIPTQAYRDEGLSYHYKKASDYVDLKNSNTVASVFSEINAPFVQGKIWTTDALFMETKNKYNSHVSDGCLAVDMETAGLQAMCDFYNFEFYGFLQTGDVLSTTSYTKNGLDKANHQTDKLYIALEIAKRIS